MILSNISPYFIQIMNTRRNVGQRRKGAAAGNNHVPPHASAEGVVMLVNPDGLTDAEVRASLALMS